MQARGSIFSYQYYNVYKILKTYIPRSYTTITADTMNGYAIELLQRHKTRAANILASNELGIRYFMEADITSYDISKMSSEQLDDVFLHLLSKNKDKQIERVVLDCIKTRKFIGDFILKKMYRSYSLTGKPEMVILLQKYCSKVDPNLHKRNGEFMHYLAKAECMKGNSEKGLKVLLEAYKKHEGLWSLYRKIYSELIQDSVLNRSEATLVIFKKNVLELSEVFGDHYPLVCFWHICWASNWFSDQMLSNELLEASESLRNIVKERATALSITILREEYNDDAVMRLLQSLLKYQMMTEYIKVLQVLFSYKLKSRDLRGCREIIRNCQALGVDLPANQQGRYIKMLIKGPEPTNKPETQNFKLKF